MSPIEREVFRVPREDRAVYLRPEAARLPALVAENRRRLGAPGVRFAGLALVEFRREARAEVLALARAYMEQWGFLRAEPPADPAAPLVLAGHQPQPFHPGVWLKNFLAASLAAATGGTALNLVVDNDEVHGQTLRVPVRRARESAAGEGVRAEEVPLAAPTGRVPFEEQPASALRPEALADLLARLPGACAAPMGRCWAHLAEAAPRAASLGEAVAVARRRLEADVGLGNLELPVSRMAESRAMRRFVGALLARHEDLFAAHNDALAEYRRVYRERSRAQPVPDLGRDGPRVELPLWVWRAGEPRRRLWLERRGAQEFCLAADREPAALVCGRDLGDAEAWADRLADFRRAGWKVRPRALALTLFARLVVGDLFIHGLGGALYDKVTDGIIERLIGTAAPGLALASCTVHLPLEAYPSTPGDLEAARRAVRDWRFNPDRLLPAQVRGRADAAALIAEKRRRVRDREPTREGRRRGWRRIREINAMLGMLHPAGAAEAAERLARVRRELAWNAILRDREYPFCYYSPEDLAAFYAEAVAPLAAPWRGRGPA